MQLQFAVHFRSFAQLTYVIERAASAIDQGNLYALERITSGLVSFRQCQRCNKGDESLSDQIDETDTTDVIASAVATLKGDFGKLGVRIRVLEHQV